MRSPVICKSPIPYLGGKSRLADQIVKRIPKDHLCYCKPFCGSAKILFAKKPSKSEVINDSDGELITFWRVVQNHLEPFLDYYRWAVISRKLFDLEKSKRPETLTDIQRACRYFYLQKLSFGGKTTDRSYGVSTERGNRLNLADLQVTLLDVHWRLEGVSIECLDGLECIRRYDRAHTFFYIDPPYIGCENDYAVAFDRFQELADLLKTIKGRFILSIGDCDLARQIFRPFRIEPVTLRYSLSFKQEARASKKSELLIQNF